MTALWSGRALRCTTHRSMPGDWCVTWTCAGETQVRGQSQTKALTTHCADIFKQHSAWFSSKDSLCSTQLNSVKQKTFGMCAKRWLKPWWARCLHIPKYLMSSSLYQVSVPLTGSCTWLEETTGPVTSHLWSSTTPPQTSGASFPQTWAMDAAMLVSLRFCVREGCKQDHIPPVYVAVSVT